MENPYEDLFGEVIFAYSRAQALEDGVLVDITPYASGCFKYPVAVTSALWELLEVKPDNRFYACESYLAKLAESTSRKIATMLLSFRLATVNPVNSDSLVFPWNFDSVDINLRAVCGPGDNPSPVITIMLEGED